MGNSLIKIKRSAVHNLIIENTNSNSEPNEGLVLPKDIMLLADIKPFEQIVATKIHGDNWKNRITTFVVPGNRVETRGSLAHFLKPDDLFCIITNSFISGKALEYYRESKLPICDLGFDPHTNKNNNTLQASAKLEYVNRKEKIDKIPEEVIQLRNDLMNRQYLSNLILDLKVTEVVDDCLLGSAEIPPDLIEFAKLEKYQNVIVANSSKGSISAETYVVPTSPGVVLMAGAMSRLASLDENAALMSYKISSGVIHPRIIKVQNNSSEHSKIVDISKL